MMLFALILLVTLAYVGLIAAFAIGLRRILGREELEIENPIRISVVVAFKDEALHLPNLLEAMMHQSFPKDRFELILVNDHSIDDSNSIVESYLPNCNNFRLRELPEHKTGKKAALAYGISCAVNPVIVFTDADCIPSLNWLDAISTEAGRGAVLMVGSVVMVPVDSFGQKIQALEYSSLMASAAGSCGIGHPVIASSANLAFRNDLLNISETTLNPEVSSGDDMFLLHHAKRVKKGRITFLMNKEAIVQTSTSNSLLEALNQRKRWASKSVHYNDAGTVFAGFVVLLFNLLLVVLLVASFFRIECLCYYFILIVVKSLVDFSLVGKYLRITGQKELLKVFLPLQFVYPFYVTYSFFAGIFIKGSWKGKKIK